VDKKFEDLNVGRKLAALGAVKDLAMDYVSE